MVKSKKELAKKFIKKAVAMVMVSLTVMSAIPVFATTGNIDWSKNVSTPGSIIRTAGEVKETDSSVIANYSSGSSDYMAVTVDAYVNGSWKDCTYYTSSNPIYVAYEGSNNYIAVLNLAYETYGRCSVAAKFTTTAAGAHRGKWRPDYQ